MNQKNHPLICSTANSRPLKNAHAKLRRVDSQPAPLPPPIFHPKFSIPCSHFCPYGARSLGSFPQNHHPSVCLTIRVALCGDSRPSSREPLLILIRNFLSYRITKNAPILANFDQFRIIFVQFVSKIVHFWSILITTFSHLPPPARPYAEQVFPFWQFSTRRAALKFQGVLSHHLKKTVPKKTKA